ncbi:MAG TPA: SdiA-regulated domain-containing protein [Sulfurovum sp.]|uniref:SdiA-regulated domain-containing protein n=1 Tax=Sulfurovum sp. TaxID=1969726 RepID=UPI002F91D96C
MRNSLWVTFIVLVTACGTPTGKVIAKIPEASGISYCAHDDTLIVANDEGSYYRLTAKGTILQKKKLGNYDLEGVVCEEDQLLFTVENDGLLVVDSKTSQKKNVPLDTRYHGKNLSLFDKKEGVEGIAKAGNMVYMAKQSKKKKSSFLAVVSMSPNPARVMDVIEHRLADTAGLAYHQGYLYMVSDKEDLLFKFDLQKNQHVKKIKLGKGAWEGIAFDARGNVYLADDEGRVVKYRKKSLGL